MTDLPLREKLEPIIDQLRHAHEQLIAGHGWPEGSEPARRSFAAALIQPQIEKLSALLSEDTK